MNNAEPQFFIYSASAGSGKTFTITKEFLRLCLSSKDPNKFKEILAITFTNKAAAEMKNRILETLESIGKGNPEGTAFETQKILLTEIEIEKEELQRRAQNVLNHILHDYSDFSISTIDHFTHRLVRTFATDLKLSPIFDVELDEKSLQTEAIDLLISKAGKEDNLTKVLNNFISERLESEKSWNLESSIQNVAEHINKERSRGFVNKLKDLNLSQFLEARKVLKTKVEALKKELTATAEEGLKLISDAGIEKHHLFGSGAILTYLTYIKDWRLDKFVPTSTLQDKVIGANKWVSKKGETEGFENAILGISAQLSELFHKVYGVVSQKLNFLYMAQEVEREFYAMAVIEEVAQCVEEIKEEENIIPITEFNHLISQEIKEQPSPYIYERLGERYKSFFIDEFQDTSIMQWQNLLPLINNALGEGGYCMLVGDAKQSIYRWRGGEAEQFIGLYEGVDLLSTNYQGDLNTVMAEVTPMNLEQNWRSNKQIVEFNNGLYEKAVGHLDNPSYQEIYRLAAQKPMGKEGGFVQVEVLEQMPKDDRAEIYLNKTLEEIKKALDAGYSYRDIAVLVKKNEYAAWLLAKFSENAIPAYSSGALMVNKSKEVAWLMAVLKWHLNPYDKALRLELLVQSLNNGLVGITEEEHHTFFKDGLERDLPDFELFVQAHFPYILEVLNSGYFLFDICEHLFYKSGIWNEGNSFISSFLDNVHNFVSTREPLMSSFIEWWELYSQRISVEPPENVNQVAVMSVHKSKGLEFPVVIVPFADWSMAKNNNDRTWMDLEDDLELPVSLISGSSKVGNVIGGEYAAKAEMMIQQAQFDQLNALYVATTRPKEVLSIITAIPTRGKSGNVYHLLSDYLDSPSAGIFNFGAYPTKEKKPLVLEEVKNAPLVNDWSERVSVSTSYPMGWPYPDKDPTRWGNMVHHLLAEVVFEEDVEPVFNRSLLNGIITQEEVPILKERVRLMLEHPAIAPLFKSGNEVYNERELISPTGEVKRPDRLVYKDGAWIIVDYKTGVEEEKHKKQVDEYAYLLGEENSTKMLIYLNEEIKVVEW